MVHIDNGTTGGITIGIGSTANFPARAHSHPRPNSNEYQRNRVVIGIIGCRLYYHVAAISASAGRSGRGDRFSETLTLNRRAARRQPTNGSRVRAIDEGIDVSEYREKDA
ncbi:hypothetical protein EVAR_43842_1 [Eumeta japonica]|uniref:Uncharacterized protein n=1 Tax=Eumeta variegata TaxID=151549 RepID=A0A4C1X141_EUMVA|nr:hypothetical protein EVAR_43842_1 [Eumeta japonica]